jgi:hypothetical protein
VHEWYAAGPLGIEQGFTLAARPAGARGPVTLAIHVAGSPRPARAGSQILFDGRSGQALLRYGGLTAIDATGRRLPAVLRVRGDSVVLAITDRRARYPVRIDPLIEQTVLVGTGASAPAEQGYSVAISGNGSTALIGGPTDSPNGQTDAGSAWVFSLSGQTSTQQAMLVGDCASACANEGTGEGAGGEFGSSVALSNSGNTALIGAPDSAQVYVFTRSGSPAAWIEQKLLTAPNSETGDFGTSVALSSTGTTALIGAPMFSVDGEGTPGAAFVYSSASDWGGTPTELDNGNAGSGFGQSVALSPDGGTALIGGPAENSNFGEAWVFTAASSWAQQGATLNGSCSAACTFGTSVALSTNGTTALIGGGGLGSSGDGNVWVFTGTPGSWTQQTVLEGNCASNCAHQGTGETQNGGFGASVAVTPTGTTALIGDWRDNKDTGAVWEFTEASGNWTQQGTKLLGGSGETDLGRFGWSVALSSNAGAVLSGTPATGSGGGGTWLFVPPAATKKSTTTKLTASANPANVAQAITYTATISPSPDGGTVAFTDNGNTISGCGGATISAGQAQCQTSPSSAGSHAIVATYSGNADYDGSTSSTLTETVGTGPTSMTLTVFPNPVIAGQPALITATVTPTPDGGTVMWQDSHGGALGCPDSTLNPGGTATCDATFTSAGSVTIMPNYSGDANYQPSTGQLTFSVEPPLAIGLAPAGQSATNAASVTSTPCGTTDIPITVLEQNVPGISALTLSSSGDTSGMSAKLSSPVLASGGVAQLELTDGGTSSGTAIFTVTATNPNDPSTPATATLTVNHTRLPYAQGLYVTQGSQYDQNPFFPSGALGSGLNYAGVTLVAGKKTVVRLYADAPNSPGGIAGVAARLYGYGTGGKSLPGSPLAPDYGPTTLPDLGLSFAATLEQVSDQELESDANAYTFTLPDSWVSGPDQGGVPTGTNIQLVGDTMLDTDSHPTGTCEGNDSFTLNDVRFDQVGKDYDATITPIPLTVNGQTPPPPAQVFQDLNAITPLHDGALGNIPYFGTGIDVSSIANSTTETAGQKEVAAASLVQAYDPFLGVGAEHFVGVSFPTVANGGYTLTIPGHYSAVDGTGDRPLTSVSHEVMHQFGLVHASAACGGGGESWPPDQLGYLDGIGVNTTTEPYQFIAAGSPDFPSYPHAYDLMSYCANAHIYVTGANIDPNDWISPRNWQQLIQNFGVTLPTANDATAAASAARAPAAAGPLAATAQVHPGELSVIGFVTSDGSQFSVGPLVGPAKANGNSGASFTLTARGAGGKVIATVPMSMLSSGHIDPPLTNGRIDSPPEPLVEVSGELPAAGVDSLQVSNNGTVVTTRQRPAVAPRISVLSPGARSRVGTKPLVTVRWRATNPEHLPLTAMVDYSTNDGRSWRTIFVGPNRDHLTVRSFDLTASRHARIRVRISDGWNQPSALSKQFVSLGAPPEVTILTQFAKRMRLAGDAAVQLSGTAIDQDAQTLTGRQLRWYDGPFLIGTGAQISAGPLPPGVNHLRLVARDPSGRTASASVTVTITAVRLPFLALAIPKHVGRKARSLTLRGSARIPTTVTIGRDRFRLTTKTKTFVLPISRGRTPLLLHVSVAAAGLTTAYAAVVTR